MGYTQTQNEFYKNSYRSDHDVLVVIFKRG